MLEFETRTDIQINNAWHEVEVLCTQGEYSYVLPPYSMTATPTPHPSGLDHVSVIKIRTDSPRLREVKFLDAVMDTGTGHLVDIADDDVLLNRRYQSVQIIVKE